MTSVAEFLKGASDRGTRTVWLAPDPDAVAAADVAAAGARGETLGTDPEDVARARESARDSAWAITVGTVGRAMWDRLISDHPATDTQQEQASAEGVKLRWNPDRFPAAAIAASLRSASNPDGGSLEFGRPKFGQDGQVTLDGDAADFVAAVWETFPFGETELLWAAVINLNVASTSTARLASFGHG